MTRRWRRLVSSSDIHYRSRASGVLCIEVPTSIGLVFEKLGTGGSSPFLVLADEGEGIDESRNINTFNFVRKNDETGRTRADEPLLELVFNLLKRRAIGGQAPVCSLAIQNYGCEAEHFRGDGPHSVVSVSVRRSPVSRNTSPSRVANDLQSPTNLTDEQVVSESCHVRMRPGVYADVVFELLERAKENFAGGRGCWLQS